jgi:acyl-CoA hydrolase
VDEIGFGVKVETPLPKSPRPELSDVEQAIGQNCAQLIDSGATLQMGIGAIPDAVLRALDTHEDLGVHTEMFSDGVIDLVEEGVITGANKAVHPGKIVGSFVMGTRALYDLIDDNPLVAMLDVAYVNDTAVIRRNPKVTAINSAIEVDLTGQVCADTIGTYQYSGVGGPMDFIRGASLSEEGKPIIALPSTTGFGISRIVPHLKEGGRRRYHPGPRAPHRHRVRLREPIRQEPPRAGPGPHRHCPSRPPGGPAAGRARALQHDGRNLTVGVKAYGRKWKASPLFSSPFSRITHA